MITDVFENNLLISDNKHVGSFIISKDTFFENAICISHTDKSCVLWNEVDLFIILKSYINNENYVIENLFFAVTNNNKKNFVQHIKMFEIKNFNDFDSFLNWWGLVALKLQNYETTNFKIEILLFLNKENIIFAYNLIFDDNCIFYNLKPVYPWKPIIFEFLESQKNYISKLKFIIKNEKNKK